MKFLKKHWKEMFVFAVLLFLFIANAFHERYPDEFDSLVGGKYILQGRLPYRDWFQHHQPGAYVFAATLLPFAFGSFVRLRVLSAIVYFFVVTGTYILIRKRSKHAISTGYYLLFAFTFAISSTYFWGEMLLADTLAAYVFIPSYFLLIVKGFYDEPFEKQDLFFVTFFGFLVWFTSMTYIYAVAGIVVFASFLYLKTSLQHKKKLKTIFLDLCVTVGSPYILFFLYLLLTGSLNDYYFANISYNQEFYIFNYPRASGAHFNPIRYAVIITNTFVNNFLPALWGVFQFPIGDPLQVTLAVSNAIFFILLCITGKYSMVFPFLIALVFVNGRSNPQAIKETDYWASVYIVLSYIHGVFSLQVLPEIINSAKEYVSKRFMACILLLILWIYWFFNPLSMFIRMEDKFYPKYMGELPLIYDRPQIAGYVNKLVDTNDYAWIGPFEFEELFYMHAKVPTKYHWFLDPAAKSKIKDEIIADLTKTMPKVIVFRRTYAPWGGDPKSYNYFMQDFLDKYYFRLFTLNDTLTDIKYKWKISNTENYDIDGDFNFNKQFQKEILDKLLALGYIEIIKNK
jgi:hypothetical protein